MKKTDKDDPVDTSIPFALVSYDDKMPEELRERAIEWMLASSLVREHFKAAKNILSKGKAQCCGGQDKK